MVQIVWLVLLFVSQVLGVDTSGIAELLQTVFGVMGVA
jgi:hypothetical protein